VSDSSSGSSELLQKRSTASAKPSLVTPRALGNHLGKGARQGQYKQYRQYRQYSWQAVRTNTEQCGHNLNHAEAVALALHTRFVLPAKPAIAAALMHSAVCAR